MNGTETLTTQDLARLDALDAIDDDQRRDALAYLSGYAPEAFDSVLQHVQATSKAA
jgi:hypothetical protein